MPRWAATRPQQPSCVSEPTNVPPASLQSCTQRLWPYRPLCPARAVRAGAKAGFEIVALNDLADQASTEYLTRFDSTHGRFPGEVKVDGDCLHINGDCVKVMRSATPEGIDWAATDIDLVLECSGAYHTRADGQRFLDAGAPRVLFSQPMASEADVDATVVYGVNQACLTGSERLVSNASCTTNCGVPLLRVLDQAFGIEYVQITTIHSAMNDQPVIDAYHHEDLRRTRSAFQSVIPVSTGLARGIERLLPELAGRIQPKRYAYRPSTSRAGHHPADRPRYQRGRSQPGAARGGAGRPAERLAGLHRVAACQL